MEQISPLPQLWAKLELCARLSISERALENMVKTGTFPPPVRIGKKVYWSDIAVRKWQEKLFSEQELWQKSRCLDKSHSNF